ncbi:hypothetical protein CEQ21_22910 [Niallia circulans]|uniref:Uncharacterized protein n=1 Tax=Niallia circulans TaxID=1397 RepID=A0A553SMN0_NIACI|nr:hypothetical protein [Niallia circulans]TRZ38255.1 hypothetical protein CEQ21_22910 [Niallia circulans]
MPVVLQSFTTPANTVRIADSATAPGAVTPVGPTIPLIDGNGSYIWSPVNVSGQSVTFRSVFSFGAPLLSVALPLTVYYAYAGNETATVTATLEVLNVLGVIVLTIPLFSGDTNLGNPLNVSTVAADTLLAASVLGGTVNITVDATVNAPITTPYDPVNTGRYLGQITVQQIVAI